MLYSLTFCPGGPIGPGLPALPCTPGSPYTTSKTSLITVNNIISLLHRFLVSLACLDLLFLQLDQYFPRQPKQTLCSQPYNNIHSFLSRPSSLVFHSDQAVPSNPVQEQIIYTHQTNFCSTSFPGSPLSPAVPFKPGSPFIPGGPCSNQRA